MTIAWRTAILADNNAHQKQMGREHFLLFLSSDRNVCFKKLSTPNIMARVMNPLKSMVEIHQISLDNLFSGCCDGCSVRAGTTKNVPPMLLELGGREFCRGDTPWQMLSSAGPMGRRQGRWVTAARREHNTCFKAISLVVEKLVFHEGSPTHMKPLGAWLQEH